MYEKGERNRIPLQYICLTQWYKERVIGELKATTINTSDSVIHRLHEKGDGRIEYHYNIYRCLTQWYIKRVTELKSTTIYTSDCNRRIKMEDNQNSLQFIRLAQWYIKRVKGELNPTTTHPPDSHVAPPPSLIPRQIYSYSIPSLWLAASFIIPRRPRNHPLSWENDSTYLSRPWLSAGGGKNKVQAEILGQVFPTAPTRTGI